MAHIDQLPMFQESASGDWIKDPMGAFASWIAQVPCETNYTFKPSSIKQMTAMFRQFAAYLEAEKTTIISIDASGVDRYLQTLPGRSKNGLSNDPTRRRHLNLLSRVFDALCRDGVRRNNPAESLSRLERYRGRSAATPNALTLSQSDALIAHLERMDTPSWMDVRDRALVSLLLGAGLTFTEIAVVRIGDVHLTDRMPHVYVDACGNRHARRAHVDEFAWGHLRAWCQLRRSMELPGDALFAEEDGTAMDKSRYHRVHAIITAAGIQGRMLSPMGLRNTFALRHLANGEGEELVRRLLGNATPHCPYRIRLLFPTHAIIQKDD